MSDYDELASALALLILFVGPLTIGAAIGHFIELYVNREE